MCSRGIDFKSVDHVINVDMARNPTIYYHRAGRTCRAGKPGVVTTFYNHRSNNI